MSVGPVVLFRDYSGLWCPLNSLYWSQSSKILASRNIKSTQEEIISQYCPQCMTRYSDDEANMYLGRCPACYQCPCCTSTLAIDTSTAGQCLLTCGMCYWNSGESGIVASDKTELDALILKAEKEGVAKDAFALLLAKYQAEENANKSRSTVVSGHKGVWQFKDLNEKLDEVQQRMTALPPYAFEEFIAERTMAGVDFTIPEGSGDQLTTIAQQCANPGKLPHLVSQLAPVRTMLRGKRTLRCRRDMELGKMNILIQSKLFPLEGDSSQRVQKGKWWVKDASAVHEVPFVSILKLPSRESLNRQEYAWLELSFTNSVEAEVHLTVSPSEEGGDAVTTGKGESYFLLNQFDKPIDASHHQLVECSPLGAPLDVPLAPYEDELLKDADTAASTASPGGSESAVASSAGGAEWSVRLDHNIAFVRVPVRLVTSVSSNVMEVRLTLTLKSEKVDPPVELPVRILF